VRGVDFVTEIPTFSFDAAIFSETVAWRYENIISFLKRSTAARFLLEKPLSADPSHIENLPSIFTCAGVSLDSVFVNFPRRTWGITQFLRELIIDSSSVQITINGGALGFGCNGIHYLDWFLHLAKTNIANIVFCKLDDILIGSGRGLHFFDYGGTVLLQAKNTNLFLSASAASSAPVLITIRGDHFLTLIDETNFTWKVLKRSSDSQLPNYRYGSDYELYESGPFQVDGLDLLTQKWLEGSADLPLLEDAIPAHNLLHSILQAGGHSPPFKYT
jgi:hypothetical protein